MFIYDISFQKIMKISSLCFSLLFYVLSIFDASFPIHHKVEWTWTGKKTSHFSIEHFLSTYSLDKTLNLSINCNTLEPNIANNNNKYNYALILLQIYKLQRIKWTKNFFDIFFLFLHRSFSKDWVQIYKINDFVLVDHEKNVKELRTYDEILRIF